jgi:hypothetical protein
VSANTVTAPSANFTHSALGGGISHGGGALTIVNTTIEGNAATGHGAAGAFGGGLYTSVER